MLCGEVGSGGGGRGGGGKESWQKKRTPLGAPKKQDILCEKNVIWHDKEVRKYVSPSLGASPHFLKFKIIISWQCLGAQQLEDPRIQWRQKRETMLSDYLVVAQSDLKVAL